MQATEALALPVPAPGRKDNTRRRRITRLVIRYVVLIIAAGIVLFPIYITLVDALLSPQQITHRPPYLFPPSPHWSTFSTAFKEGDLGIYLRNSAIVTIAVVVFEIVTSVLAAYAFVFLRFPFRKILFAGAGHAHGPGRGDDHPQLPDDRQVRPAQHLPGADPAVSRQRHRHLLVPAGLLELPPRSRTPPSSTGAGTSSSSSGSWCRSIARSSAPSACFAFLTSWNQYLWPLVVTQPTASERSRSDCAS